MSSERQSNDRNFELSLDGDNLMVKILDSLFEIRSLGCEFTRLIEATYDDLFNLCNCF